jgi:hypothetical protein
MKKLILFVFVLLALINCKNNGPELKNVDSLTGKWRLISNGQRTSAGQTVWQDVPLDKTHRFIFRSDGVILDQDSLPSCCVPSALRVNGAYFEIKPKSPLLPNPTCAAVNCAPCATWDIAQQENEITIISCGSLQSKYVRD